MALDTRAYHQFEVGHLVELNSGGPAMTVVDVEKEGNADALISVVFFSDDGAYDFSVPAICLKPYLDKTPLLTL